MNPKSSSLLAWIGVIIAGIALAVAFIALSASGKAPGDSSSSFGNSQGGPVFNAGATFPVGLQLGAQKQNTSAASISIGPGQNQASWCNTGPAAVVFDAFATLEGTSTASFASSTYKLYVGTSTKATSPAANDYTSWYAGLINGTTFATGTPVNTVIADNAVGHAGSVTGSVYVANGVCVVAQVEQTYGCKTDGSCNTATSSSRGWSGISIPFYYKQR